MTKFNLGDIVSLPSGEIGQIRGIKVYWKLKHPTDEFGFIEARTDIDLKIGNGFTGRDLKIADYQLKFIDCMPVAE